MPINVTITRLPIIGITGCCVPVVPGTMDCEAPLDERTDLCAVDADWVFGAVPTCDVHLRQIAEMMEWDWPELLAESGRDLDSANRPADERQRHSQEHTRAGLEAMTR